MIWTSCGIIMENEFFFGKWWKLRRIRILTGDNRDFSYKKENSKESKFKEKEGYPNLLNIYSIVGRRKCFEWCLVWTFFLWLKFYTISRHENVVIRELTFCNCNLVYYIVDLFGLFLECRARMQTECIQNTLTLVMVFILLIVHKRQKVALLYVLSYFAEQWNLMSCY